MFSKRGQKIETLITILILAFLCLCTSAEIVDNNEPDRQVKVSEGCVFRTRFVTIDSDVSRRDGKPRSLMQTAAPAPSGTSNTSEAIDGMIPRLLAWMRSANSTQHHRHHHHTAAYYRKLKNKPPPPPPSPSNSHTSPKHHHTPAYYQKHKKNQKVPSATNTSSPSSSPPKHHHTPAYYQKHKKSPSPQHSTATKPSPPKHHHTPAYYRKHKNKPPPPPVKKVPSPPPPSKKHPPGHHHHKKPPHSPPSKNKHSPPRLPPSPQRSPPPPPPVPRPPKKHHHHPSGKHKKSPPPPGSKHVSPVPPKSEPPGSQPPMNNGSRPLAIYRNQMCQSRNLLSKNVVGGRRYGITFYHACQNQVATSIDCCQKCKSSDGCQGWFFNKLDCTAFNGASSAGVCYLLSDALLAYQTPGSLTGGVQWTADQSGWNLASDWSGDHAVAMDTGQQIGDFELQY